MGERCPARESRAFCRGYVSFSKENDVYLTNGYEIVFPDGNVEHYDYPYHFVHVFDGLIPFTLDKLSLSFTASTLAPENLAF